MESSPNSNHPPIDARDAKILSDIDSALAQHGQELQDEFERHMRWLLNQGEMSELQYYEAVTAYRSANQRDAGSEE